MIDLGLLRRMPLFGGLSDEQVREVAAALRGRVVPAGEAVFREGERSTSVYILARGSAGTSKRLGLAIRAPVDATRQKTLVRLVAPQFFGEVGLLSDLERSATVTTESECEILELSREDFERLAAHDPQLGYQVLRNIAAVLVDRLRRTDLDVVKLTAALSLALGNR